MLLAWLLLSAPADAAKLHRCEVRLELPVGAVEVPGFGHDEAAALARARRAAAILASQHAHAELLGGLVADPAAALGRHVAALQALDLDDDAPAPGYPVTDGDCARARLPANPDRLAWSAVWADGGAPVLRTDVASAIEGARRRTCVGSYQIAVNAALARSEEADDPWRVLVSGLADARDALLRCATEVSPEIAPALAGLPQVDATGPFVCHRPRRLAGGEVGDGWTTSPGFGDTLEDAREAALHRDVLVVSRRVAGEALRAAGRAPDPAAVRAALDPLRTLVVGSDAVEQALLLCAAGPPVSSAFAWTPAPGCGAPEPPISLVVSAPALERLAGDRCDHVLSAGTRDTLVHLSGARAGDGALAIQGLGAALGCAASCGSDVEIRGWTPRPVHRANELDRSTPEAAAAALRDAVARRDLDAFGVLTGGVMLHPSYAAVARRDPDAFWGSLEQAGRAGTLDDVARWEHVAGGWLLTFE